MKNTIKLMELNKELNTIDNALWTKSILKKFTK